MMHLLIFSTRNELSPGSCVLLAGSKLMTACHTGTSHIPTLWLIMELRLHTRDGHEQTGRCVESVIVMCQVHLPHHLITSTYPGEGFAERHAHMQQRDTRRHTTTHLTHTISLSNLSFPSSCSDADHNRYFIFLINRIQFVWLCFKLTNSFRQTSGGLFNKDSPSSFLLSVYTN